MDVNPLSSIATDYSTVKFDNFCIVMSNSSMSYTKHLKVSCQDEVKLIDSIKGDCNMRAGQSSSKEDYLGLISGIYTCLIIIICYIFQLTKIYGA